MTGPWHYGGDLTTPEDMVRYLIGDTTQSRHSPTDTEVKYWVNTYTIEGITDTYAAAAKLAKHMATRFRTLSNTQVKIGDMTLVNNYATLADQFDDIAADLEGGPNPTGGGGPLFDNSRSGAFSMGLMDNL